LEEADATQAVELLKRRMHDEVRSLAALTLDWKGLTDKDEEVKFSTAAAIDLYTKSPNVRRQVRNFKANPTNYALQ
jgi:hypothetical protein